MKKHNKCKVSELTFVLRYPQLVELEEPGSDLNFKQWKVAENSTMKLECITVLAVIFFIIMNNIMW